MRGPGPSDSPYVPIKTLGATAQNMWMVTITDLISLLFAFFVMLFSMRTLETPLDPAAYMTDLLPTRAEVPINVETDTVHVERNIRAVDPPRAFATEYLSKLLRDMIDETPSLSEVTLSLQDDLIVLKLPQNLWTPSAADSTAQVELHALAQFLNRLQNRVVATGARYGGFETTQAWSQGLDDAAKAANNLKNAGFFGSLDIQSRLATSSSDEGVYLYILGEGDGS